MKKQAKFGLLGLAAVGAGAASGVAALSNYLYNLAMVPRKRNPELFEDNHLQAEGRRWARAAEGFRSVTIQAVDGLQLWSVFLPAEGSHRWAICMHGYHDTYESMGAIGRRYYETGWNVLMPDQRGHGKSEGDYVGWGYDERLDLVAWINHVVRRDPQAEIVIHGVSMGAATVLMATGGPLPRQVKAAVSDCAFTTVEEEMRHVVLQRAKRMPSIPASVPVGVLFALLRRTALRRAGYDLRNAAPEAAVAHSKTPTLFIHGTEDTLVPDYMMSRLYQAARCPKSFLWLPEAGHAMAVGTDPDLYWATVDTFLQEHLETPI